METAKEKQRVCAAFLRELVERVFGRGRRRVVPLQHEEKGEALANCPPDSPCRVHPLVLN